MACDDVYELFQSFKHHSGQKVQKKQRRVFFILFRLFWFCYCKPRIHANLYVSYMLYQHFYNVCHIAVTSITFFMLGGGEAVVDGVTDTCCARDRRLRQCLSAQDHRPLFLKMSSRFLNVWWATQPDIYDAMWWHLQDFLVTTKPDVYDEISGHFSDVVVPIKNWYL